MTAIVLDSLFVGLTIYVAAMFRDLRDTITHIEDDLHKSEDLIQIKEFEIVNRYSVFAG